MRTHIALAALLVCAAAAAGDISLFSNKTSFIVSIAPVDEESRLADSTILWQRAGTTGDWTQLGDCQKHTLPDGGIRWTRTVTVDTDGLYQFTSRPVVGGKVQSPPGPDAAPQARVTVDTLAPAVDILAPAEGARQTAGADLVIEWTATDENLEANPVALAWSADGGQSWTLLQSGLPAAGSLAWTLPPDPLPVVLRAAAADRAGNVGRALRGLDVKPAEPAEPPTRPAQVIQAPTAQAPEQPRRPATVTQSVVRPPEPADTEEAFLPDPEPEPAERAAKDRNNRSWLYYLMALNQMRQNKPADALQYYWLSVKEDPDFIEPWADMGLAYTSLGAFKSARDVLTRARGKAPHRADLMHMMGEVDQAEGMRLLAKAGSPEQKMRAKGLIDSAVQWYGRAIRQAEEDWRLSEMAVTFYRLGEICYYVNMDRDGARAYWARILELHSPTPNRDLMDYSPWDNRAREEHRYQRYTHQRVTLDTWQTWARGYIEQLDAFERRGIRDMTNAPGPGLPPVQPLAWGANALGPGREDGRSLFSLPAQAGTEQAVPIAPRTPVRQGNTAAPGPAAAPVDDYEFYGTARRYAPGTDTRDARVYRGESMFSGGPERPAVNPDPYAMPQRRPNVGWNAFERYGDRPDNNW